MLEVDIAANKALGKYGAIFIKTLHPNKDQVNVLVHTNTKCI
jgi:hypothetical protein